MHLKKHITLTQISSLFILGLVFPTLVLGQTPTFVNMGGYSNTPTPTLYLGGQQGTTVPTTTQPTNTPLPDLNGGNATLTPAMTGQTSPQPTQSSGSPTPVQNWIPYVNCTPAGVNNANSVNEALTNKNKKRSRKGSNNNNQGLFQQIIKIIQQLLQMIMQLLGASGGTLPDFGTPGGQNPTQAPIQQNPTSAPNPTIPQNPGGNQNPSVTLPPCPTNTPAVTQGTGQPTPTQPAGGQQTTIAPTQQIGATPTAAASPAQSASAPILPAVNGPCPEFKTGIVTFTPKNAPANQAQLYVGANPGNGPLVFYFHGTGEASGFSSKGPSWLGQNVINEITSQGGVVIVPKGHGGYEWIIANGDTSPEDLYLVDEMVACAIQKANIDPKRIHATGLSSGATLTSDLIHRRSNYLASGAPQSGGWDPYNPIPANQNPNNKISAMIIHGGPSDTWPSNECEKYEPQSIIMANKLLQ